MSNVAEKFLAYVKIDTQSDRYSETTPSTRKQLDLAKLLVKELKALKLENVTLSEHGYVMATLPANIPNFTGPTIGFIAHMDTSPDFTAENVSPKLVENYHGGDLPLDDAGEIVLSPKEFPELANYKGKTLITTDGSTLLGADDKAGIAEIMTAIEHLVQHPEIPHGPIRIGFTPDEEVGRGADYFDVEAFNADFAYTLDGGEIGDLNYENFNAAGAEIIIHGRSVHPGSAKDKMVNAIMIAIELAQMLPDRERPEHTEEYEGFFHLFELEGDVERARMVYILRDHDREKYNARIELLERSASTLNARYGVGTVELTIKEQYRNMKEKLLPHMHIVDTAKEAMQSLGIEPLITPIRGGTDGSRLSYMGLLTPNIFTGGHNFHGNYEYICLESMESAVQVILKIIELYAAK
ncbi:MAG: peptidase T [Anaerolineaceae bacterium]|jgi:tripeptide aminopeptidase|nr:peptidase T [Anaerolineaceae bacterium]